MKVSVTTSPGGRARVTVEVEAGTTMRMSVYRVVGGRDVPLLGGRDLPAESTVIDDVEVDLNVPVRWRAVLSDGFSAVSDFVVVTSQYPILSNPYTGRWVPVVLVSLGEEQAGQRGKAIDIEESDQVVFVYDVESAVRREITLMTLTAAARNAFLELVAAGGPLLLRCACQRHPVGWFVRDGGQRTSKKLDPLSRNDWWVHSWAATVSVAAPRPDERPVGDTLGDLHQAVPTTLAAIAAQWATLGDIARADLKAG